MKSSSQLGRKKAAVGVGAVLLLAASLITVANIAGAQGGIFAGCPDDAVTFGVEGEFFGFENYENHLISSGPTSQTTAFALPAGTYEIGAVSTDGYPLREETQDQPTEQWYAEFLAADGSVVATTGTTADIATGIEQGIWSGSIGEVTLTSDAVTVRAVHATPGSPSPNSVRAVCVGATPIEGPPSAFESSITVDFDSENIDASAVSVVCGDEELSDTDTAVDHVIDPVDPGTTCVVEWPSEHTCTMAVTPEDQIELVVGEGIKTITFPTDVGVDVFVDIDCNAPVECSNSAGAAVEANADGTCPVECSDAAGAAVEANADGTCPTTEVLGETVVETQVLQDVVTAPVAQVQPGTPTFTG